MSLLFQCWDSDKLYLSSTTTLLCTLSYVNICVWSGHLISSFQFPSNLICAKTLFKTSGREYGSVAVYYWRKTNKNDHYFELLWFSFMLRFFFQSSLVDFAINACYFFNLFKWRMFRLTGVLWRFTYCGLHWENVQPQLCPENFDCQIVSA